MVHIALKFSFITKRAVREVEAHLRAGSFTDNPRFIRVEYDTAGDGGGSITLSGIGPDEDNAVRAIREVAALTRLKELN